MPIWMIVTVVALLAVGLFVWTVSTHRAKRRAVAEGLDRLGFRPCPEERERLEQIVREIDNNPGYRYEVREPRRLAGDPAVYYYVKARFDPESDTPLIEEEVLLPIERSSGSGLVLIVKPTSIPPGLASRILGSVATGPWDSQPDDLKPLEIPPDLKDTNLVGALGPPGSRLYDQMDGRMLGAVLPLGDAGGMFVRLRGPWCAVAGASAQIPFRVEQVIAGVRPLLRTERSRPGPAVG